jgi:solute carrier family 45 protein 1/2/4
VIACIALGSTVLVSSLFIRERDPRLEGPPSQEKGGVLSFFRQVFASMKRLPLQVRKVCEVQFFAWIGWFPFLFYITTYIGQLYVNPYFEENPDLTSGEIDKHWEDATRVGTFALLMFAITSLSANILLPFIITPTYRAPAQLTRPGFSPHEHDRPSTPGTPGPGSMHSFFPPTPSPETHSRLARLLSACQIPWLTLRRAWLLSHVLFACCMASTFFITSIAAGTVLVAVIGLSWALTLWAPFALISAEISKRDTARRQRKSRNGHEDDSGNGDGEDQAGVILGLHNVAIASPQIIATLVSSAIFKLAQRDRGVAGDDSVGWVLRFGGCAALIAAYMTTRVGEEARGNGEIGTEDEVEALEGV